MPRSSLPADCAQQKLCRLEVERIRTAGEVYRNGRLMASGVYAVPQQPGVVVHVRTGTRVERELRTAPHTMRSLRQATGLSTDVLKSCLWRLRKRGRLASEPSADGMRYWLKGAPCWCRS